MEFECRLFKRQINICSFSDKLNNNNKLIICDQYLPGLASLLYWPMYNTQTYGATKIFHIPLILFYKVLTIIKLRFEF